MHKQISAQMFKEEALDKDFLELLAFNEKMAELGKLAAGIVHELNTPLSVIVSASQMILREQELSEFVREMVERIGDEAQRLAHMSRGVLSFSRQESGTDLEADLNEVLHDVMAFLRYEAQKRSIKIHEELDFHLPAVSIGRNYLKQILINLVMNAFQAIAAEGTLRLRTAVLEDASIIVQISDNGCGIPEEKLGNIFDPFFSTKSNGEGTGMGLYVTKQIIEMFGGSIAVTSCVGVGSTFTVKLPRAI